MRQKKEPLKSMCFPMSARLVFIGSSPALTRTFCVGTCPKDFWEEWIAEGDAAGDPETGEEWETRGRGSIF